MHDTQFNLFCKYLSRINIEDSINLKFSNITSYQAYYGVCVCLKKAARCTSFRLRKVREGSYHLVYCTSYYLDFHTRCCF